MRETTDTLPYGKYLPDVYRFAFLMTGNADTAADVLRHTVRQAARGCLHDIRDPLRAKRWLFAEARTLCAHPPPTVPRGDVPLGSVPGSTDPGEPAASPAPLAAVPAEDVPAATDDPPRQLALLFAGLAEDERTALILFYLFLFDPAELAELLEIKPADLGPLLLRGRTELQRDGVRYENLFTAADASAEAIPDAA